MVGLIIYTLVDENFMIYVKKEEEKEEKTIETNKQFTNLLLQS